MDNVLKINLCYVGSQERGEYRHAGYILVTAFDWRDCLVKVYESVVRTATGDAADAAKPEPPTMQSLLRTPRLRRDNR